MYIISMYSSHPPPLFFALETVNTEVYTTTTTTTATTTTTCIYIYVCILVNPPPSLLGTEGSHGTTSLCKGQIGMHIPATKYFII